MTARILVLTAMVSVAMASPIPIPATLDSGPYRYSLDRASNGTASTLLRIDGPGGAEDFVFGGIDSLDGFAVTANGLAVMAGRFYGEAFLRYAAYGFGGSEACATTAMVASGPCANLVSRSHNAGELFGTVSWFVSGTHGPSILRLDESGRLVAELFVDDMSPYAADVTSYWVPYSVDLPLSGLHNPEPSTVALAAGGLALLLLLRGRTLC